jgi:hypothetical protein
VSQLLPISHEPPASGRSRIDIVGTSDVRFAADVATVFDDGLHEDNPVEQFRTRIVEEAKRLGLPPRGLQLHVEGERRRARHGSVMRLRLASTPVLDDVLREQVRPFLEECKREAKTRQIELRAPGLGAILVFDPSHPYLGGSHPSYTTAYSLTNNPLFNSLKRKGTQLRQSRTEAPLVIIACAANTKFFGTGGVGFSAEAITREYLRQNTSIATILLVESVPVMTLGSLGKPTIKSLLVRNPAAEDGPTVQRMNQALSMVRNRLPQPLNDGQNAYNALAFWRWKRGTYFYGSWGVAEDHVRISVRTLMEYLAGRMSQEEFLAANGGRQGFTAFFEQKLREGRMLAGVEVDPVADQDDDWITFRFTPPDPGPGRIKP